MSARLHLPTGGSRALRFTGVLAACGAVVIGTAALFREAAVHHRARGFVVRDGAIYQGKERLLLNGVVWDPERPGEVPWGPRTGPVPLDEDFARIRAIGFNMVRSWGALTPEQLGAAARHGLFVLQGLGIDPHLRFSQAAACERAIEQAILVVRNSRAFPNVLGYVLMQEPPIRHVHSEGIDAARAFLRNAAATIRRWDPGALITFATAPGLEALEDAALDLVAVNLQPERVRSLSEALGYGGVVRLWRERLSAGRPLVITEYGAPTGPPSTPLTPKRSTPEEQAALLPRLAGGAARAGVSGLALLSWADSWWKNGEAGQDEHSHDTQDPNEWYGLIAFEGRDDRLGSPRPALATMWQWNRAIMTQPVDGPLTSKRVEIRAYVEERAEAQVWVDVPGHPRETLSMIRKGRWASASHDLPEAAKGAVRVTYTLLLSGEPVGRSERVLVLPEGAPVVSIELSGSGSSRTVLVRLRTEGRPIADTEVRVGTHEASGGYDRTLVLRTNAEGLAWGPVWVPPAPSQLLVVAAWRPTEMDAPLAYEAVIIPGAGTR